MKVVVMGSGQEKIRIEVREFLKRGKQVGEREYKDRIERGPVKCMR